MVMIISHRGNLEGPNPDWENNPKQIDHCIAQGINIEIDLRVVGDECWLGHDEPQYCVDDVWLMTRREFLWIHCKNIEAVYHLNRPTMNMHYFWHDTDDYTITSNGWIWAYPDKSVPQPHLGSKSVCVMPEIYKTDTTNFQAICTDYVKTYTI